MPRGGTTLNGLEAVRLSLAGAAIAHGDVLRAADHLRAYRTQAPGDPRGILAEAELAFAGGDRAAALSLSAALTGEPAVAAPAHALRAEVRSAGREDGAALIEAERAMDLAVDGTVRAAAQLVIGDIALRRRRRDLASSAYLMAEEIRPSSRSALGLARCALLNGMTGPAFRYAQGALRRDRDDAEGYEVLYQAVYANGTYRYAAEVRTGALLASELIAWERPYDAAPLLVRARLALEVNDGELAAQCLDRAVQLPTRGRYAAHLLRGDLELRRGHYPEAASDLSVYLGFAPGDAEATRQLALCYQLAGDEARARAYLQEAIRLESALTSA